MPLRVTLIMKTSTGAVALVNGSPVRLGERIGLTHWRLTRITPEERSVEFSHDETGDVRIEALPGP